MGQVTNTTKQLGNVGVNNLGKAITNRASINLDEA